MGTTIDINQRANPFEPRGRVAKTDMPEKVEKLAWLHRMSWGARFGDAQHFETMSKGAWKNKLDQLVREKLISKEEAKRLYILHFKKVWNKIHCAHSWAVIH